MERSTTRKAIPGKKPPPRKNTPTNRPQKPKRKKDRRPGLLRRSQDEDNSSRWGAPTREGCTLGSLTSLNSRTSASRKPMASKKNKTTAGYTLFLLNNSTWAKSLPWPAGPLTASVPSAQKKASVPAGSRKGTQLGPFSGS